MTLIQDWWPRPHGLVPEPLVGGEQPHSLTHLKGDGFLTLLQQKPPFGVPLALQDPFGSLGGQVTAAQRTHVSPPSVTSASQAMSANRQVVAASQPPASYLWGASRCKVHLLYTQSRRTMAEGRGGSGLFCS